MVYRTERYPMGPSLSIVKSNRVFEMSGSDYLPSVI